MAFLWEGFNLFKAAKPLQGDSLFLTTELSGISGYIQYCQNIGRVHFIFV